MEAEELKHLVKQGDNDSRRRLFEAYYRKTYAVAYNILRSRENAEDITQDAFIKAFQNINQLKDGSKFGAWMAVIASNLARNYLKREKKVLYTDEEAVTSGASEANYTEDAALRTLDTERVREAIKKLPPEQYQLIVLQYYYDLRVEDIASMLKLRIGTVKSRLHRARNRLAQDLELMDDSVCLLSEGGEREK
ncbi:MAG: RNA polymerase sigma factor [Bacillota bacterium]